MTLEPYRNEDFSAFIGLLNAIASASGAPTTSAAEQLEFEGWLERDLTKTRVVVRHPEAPEVLTAHADLYVTEKAEANLSSGVHPDWQGEELESRLLEWLDYRSRALGATAQNIFSPASDRYRRAFLEQNGFEVAGKYHKLMLEDLSEEAPSLPNIYALKSYATAKNDALFIEAMNRSFADLWGHGVATGAVWQKILELQTPEHLFALTFEGDAVGFFDIRLSQDESKTGGLGSPGLAADHRSPDLYKALAAEGLRRLADEGVEQVSLESWGDADTTLQAYKALGFKTVASELGYQRLLTD